MTILSCWPLASLPSGMCVRPAGSPLAASEDREEKLTVPVVIPATAAVILDDIESSDAPVTLVNFWATWCSPCIEEFPEIVRLAEHFESRGLRVLFVSVDFLEDLDSVRTFLDHAGWETSSYIKKGKDHEFVEAFNSPWTGAVPATILYTRGGERVEFYPVKTSFDQLSYRISDILKESE